MGGGYLWSGDVCSVFLFLSSTNFLSLLFFLTCVPFISFFHFFFVLLHLLLIPNFSSINFQLFFPFSSSTDLDIPDVSVMATGDLNNFKSMS